MKGIHQQQIRYSTQTNERFLKTRISCNPAFSPLPGQPVHEQRPWEHVVYDKLVIIRLIVFLFTSRTDYKSLQAHCPDPLQ